MFVRLGWVYLLGIEIVNVVTQHGVEVKPGGCSQEGCDSDILAEAIEASINQTIDPCNNFYQFACGGFLANPDAPVNVPSWSVITRMQESIKRELHELLVMDDDDSDAEPVSFERLKSTPNFWKKARDFYTTCMNEEFLEARGLKDLVSSLMNLNPWPILDGVSNFLPSWRQQDLSPLEDTLIYMTWQGHSANMLVNLDVTVTADNTDTWTLQLDQPSTGLLRDFLLDQQDTDIRTVYGQMMEDVAVDLGVSPCKAKSDMQKVLQFEIELAKITVSEIEKSELFTKSNPMTIYQLERRYPYFRWFYFISSCVKDFAEIRKDEQINVVVPSFYDKLGPLLKKTPKDVIYNYLFWRVIFENKSFLNNQTTQLWRKVSAAAAGVTINSPRWEFCLVVMEEYLKTLIGSIYVRNHFTEDDRKSSKDLVKLFHLNYINLISEQNWMDNKTRHIAMDKAKQMLFFVGYPDELLNDDILNNYYKDLDLSGASFIQKVAATRRHKFVKKWSRLHTRVDKNSWVDHSYMSDVNAYNEPATNGVIITAGILRDLFFSRQRPLYLNVAANAYIIGHELFHSIDDNGRKYNAKGVVDNWWSSETEAEFNKRANEIINHYSKYKVTDIDMDVNGENVIGEVLADHGGLKLAYKTMKYLKALKTASLQTRSRSRRRKPLMFQNWLPDLLQKQERNKKETTKPKVKFHLPPEKKLKRTGITLSKLKFSHEQLFWLSAALPWCTKVSPKYLEILVLVDPHLQTDVRVNGPFRNNPDFAKDWNCSRGSYMNPYTRFNVF